MNQNRKWYNNHKFPLIASIITTRGDEQNTSNFSFHWLLLQVWSMDSFAFEFAVVFDPTHWGVGITIILPYLRIVFTIPPNQKIMTWWMKTLWRRVK